MPDSTTEEADPEGVSCSGMLPCARTRKRYIRRLYCEDLMRGVAAMPKKYNRMFGDEPGAIIKGLPDDKRDLIKDATKEDFYHRIPGGDPMEWRAG